MNVPENLPLDHTFSVDLPGLIDLLGRRLHDYPDYLIRDLIGLAADAIRAREVLDADYSGSIIIEVLSGKMLTLAFLDDGLGLTEAEARESLGTIGRPGFGVLSCFRATDEIAVISKSARPGSHPVIEWRGRSDGSYSIRTFDREMQPGTQVYVTCKPEHEQFFGFEPLCERLRDFAGCLPYPIRVLYGEESVEIARASPPWRRRFTSTEQQTRELLEFGQEFFEMAFLDAIPIRSKGGEIEGVAYVLPDRSVPSDANHHVVCLNEIMLSDSVDWMLPDWADFFSCVVNIQGPQPTTSRESIVWEEALDEAAISIGDCLRDYLVGVAARDPKMLCQLVDLHGDSIKLLALVDDEFYRLLIDWLVFETSMGEMTLGDYRERYGSVLFVEDEDEFREITPIASARGICILFSPSWADTELLTRLPILIEGAKCEALDSDDWQPTEDTKDDRHFHALVVVADDVLRPYPCMVLMETYLPGDPPALYDLGMDGMTLEEMEEAEANDPPNLEVERMYAIPPCLRLNSRHPLIRNLALMTDRTKQERLIEMLYLQAMLAGRYPLGPLEMALVNVGMIEALGKLVTE